MGTLTSLPFPETADDRTSHEGKPTYGVLSRARTRYCSPTDMHPRVGTAATLYTGCERRADGQEIYHAIFLNARMLIHNPLTGEPGACNGHVVATLYASPMYNKTWDLETPYPIEENVDTVMMKYGSGTRREVSRQHRRGHFTLTRGRKIQRDTTNLEYESDISEGWKPSYSPPLPAPVPWRLIASPMTLESHPSRESTSSFRYLTHPIGIPPPMDTSDMEVPKASALLHLWDRKLPQPEWTRPLARATTAAMTSLHQESLNLAQHFNPKVPFVFSMIQAVEDPEEPARKMLKGDAGTETQKEERNDKDEHVGTITQPPCMEPSPEQLDDLSSYQPDMPVYGSGKRGSVVTRDCFSSSLSSVATNSSDKASDIFPQLPFRVVGPTFASSRDPCPSHRQNLWKSLEGSEVCGAAPIFNQLLTTNVQKVQESVNSSSTGSPPPLVPISSSESGEEDLSQEKISIDNAPSDKTGGNCEFEVETREVHQTLSTLCYCPPTPFVDENLQGHNWAKIYRELKDVQAAREIEKGKEDGAVLRPLWDILHTMNKLTSILDNVAMVSGDMADADTVEQLTQPVSGQWKEARDR
ncbi:hypothetical protein B0H13DRAFT_1922392, partial [Mycena leptocephala]